jgi:hypothetical protein
MTEHMPSTPLQKTRDFIASVVTGAVSSFLGTSGFAGFYALGSGIAGNLGLNTGLSALSGMAIMMFGGGAGLITGGIAAMIGLFALDSIPFFNKAKMGTKGAMLGAALGIAGSVTVAHHLSQPSAPPQHASLSQSFSNAQNQPANPPAVEAPKAKAATPAPVGTVKPPIYAPSHP